MNLDKLTYKQKNIALAAGFVLCMIISYWLAFGETVKLLSDNSKMQAQADNLGSAPQQLALYRQKLDKLNQKLGYSTAEGESAQEHILGFISSYCDEKQADHKGNTQQSAGY